MRQRSREIVMGWRRRLFTPILARFDLLDGRLDSIENRLEKLGRHLGDIEALTQADGTRESTLAERTVALSESDARIAKRIDEIERILGGTTGN